jgi:hypothetical protein
MTAFAEIAARIVKTLRGFWLILRKIWRCFSLKIQRFSETAPSVRRFFPRYEKKSAEKKEK